MNAGTSSGTEVALRLVAIGASAVADQSDELARIGARLAELVAAGGRILTFGAGHAQAFAMELCNRAGGLPGVIAMNLQDISPDRRDYHWTLRDSAPERVEANGPALLDHHRVSRGDAVLIASQSGRNGAVVELAVQARRRGGYVVAVSSLRHSTAFASRHPSGLRLHEVADDHLDNGVPVGDAVVALPSGRRACAASSVSFMLIAQALNAEVIGHLVGAGTEPAVLVSANIDSAGADSAGLDTAGANGASRPGRS